MIETLFLHYITLLGGWIYVLIFIGMFVEGDAILFTAFYLASLGDLNVWTLIAVAIIGVIFGDIIWYKLGEHLEKRSGFFRKIAAKITKPLDKRLAIRPISTLCITKFTYGIHHAVLLRAGATKLPFKKYIITMFCAAVFWTSVIGGLAYFSFVSFDLLKKYIKYGEIGLLFGIILFWIITHFLTKIGNKKIEEEQ
ncbi:MAG: VTT domain-containing protein [Patescibacteria group bacterium]